MRPPPLRTMRQFAEEEIVVPDGPCKGQRFRVARNPVAGLWFDQIDSGRFRRFAATALTQNGKTFLCNVIPALYHLFERAESVVYGVPNMDVGNDKWNKDLQPAIRASRYAGLLPRRGAGSQGGESIDVTFGNGASLRFMSGRGGDEARSGYTAPVVVVTEADKMDQAGDGSKEADPITQLERRTSAYGSASRVYFECTPSVEEGRIWQEITVRGTDSRIALKCPHCAAFVTPEREHLIGWQDAVDVVAAGEAARLVCPGCGEVWEEADRVSANRNGRVVHKGQELAPNGTLTGPPPRTDTLGFRWSVVNNLLASDAISLAGRDEWAAKRAPDEDNAEKGLLQFTWAKPYKPSKVDLTAIDAGVIARRMAQPGRGLVPADAHAITVAVDLGKWLCHWGAVAWRDDATPHVIEYGRLEVASSDLGEEAALLAALRTFRDTVCDEGFECDGKKMKAKLGFVDAGWHQQVAMLFCAESPGFVAAKGRGVGQLGAAGKQRRATGSKVIAVGDGYEIVQLPGEKVPLVEIDVDKWKSWVHARLQTPVGKPGALTLYQTGTAHEHQSFAKHLTAEKKVEEFVAGKGVVTRWQMLNRNNHWLDVLMLASVAGHASGERLADQAKPVMMMTPAPEPPERRNPLDYRGKW